jgi:hypothetical protein
MNTDWNCVSENGIESNAPAQRRHTWDASQTPEGPAPRHGPLAATAAEAALAAALAASRATAAAWVAIRVAVITMLVSSSSNGMVASSPSPVEKPRLSPPPASTRAAAADASAAAVAACAAAFAASAAADCAAAVARSTATAAGLLAGMRGHPSSAPAGASPLPDALPSAAPRRDLAPAGGASAYGCSSALASSSADSVLSSQPGDPLWGGGTSPHSSEASACAGEALSQPMGSSMALGSAGASSAACCPSALAGLLAGPPCDAALLVCPFTGALLLGCPGTCRVDGGDAGDRGRSHGLVLCCVATAAPFAACRAGSRDCPPLKLRHRTAEARAKPDARATPAKAAHSLEAAILRTGVTAGRSHVPIGVAALGGWPGPGAGRTQSAPNTKLRGAGEAAAASPPVAAPCCRETASPAAAESLSPSPVDDTAACAVVRLRDVTFCLWQERTCQPSGAARLPGPRDAS